MTTTTGIQDAISTAIRAQLAERNCTQTCLGKILHISQAAVANKLSGFRKWLLEDLALIATAWDVPVSVLLGEPQPAPA